MGSEMCIRDSNNAPKSSAIKIEVETRNDLTEAVYNDTMKVLDADVEPIAKIDFLVNKTEEWCQERAIVNAVYKAVNVIGGEDKKTPMSALPELLTEAISTSLSPVPMITGLSQVVPELFPVHNLTSLIVTL